jgi:glutaredoxin
LKENMYIKLYGKKNCPQCEQAKALLESKSLGYEYIDLGSSIEAMQEAKAKGWRSVPQISIDGEWIGGYKELVAYIDRL